MRNRWRSECGRYVVEIKPSALQQMVRLAREHWPNEVGSALVGTYTKDGDLARVTGLAPIAPDSKGKRTAYVRGVEGVTEFFQSLFASSKGRHYYVGEWHSHPGGRPVPSGVDDRNGAAIARNPREMCPECIMVIIGGWEKPDIGVYIYSRVRGRLNLYRV